MGKANPLSTDSINYLDLIGNGKSYRVPPYQREYSWTDEQWEDLWNDIHDLRQESGNDHYMGALVVEGKSDREFLIIDGQQRLATISLLALAVINKLCKMADQGVEPEKNRERSVNLRNRFIGEKDPASLIEASRLHLNEADDGFYQDYLVQMRPPHNPKGLPKSNRLLWQCFQYFQNNLDQIEDIQEDGEAVAKLLSETVARKLRFIRITVDDELNAYTVFETLNARGLELTTTDLLKNYLFSKVNVANDLVALERRWKSLITITPQERFPDLLRYHLLCEVPAIRKQRLFKLVRERFKTPGQIFGLLEELEERAELFAALSDCDHNYWSDLPEAKRHIRDLTLFRVRQATPLLFAAWERWFQDNKQNFTGVLRLVSVISFRYTVVGGLNPNKLEPEYHKAAKSILDGSAKNPAAVFEKLRRIYVEDEKFRNDFSQMTVQTKGIGKKLAKYILCRLEEDESGRSRDPETDPATIEHILPENPPSDWDGVFPPDKREAAVYRLGNLTLLESSRNRDIGSEVYALKLSAYEKSDYVLTRRIPRIAPEEWTMDFVGKRQEKLAHRAVHVWRVDYDV